MGTYRRRGYYTRWRDMEHAPIAVRHPQRSRATFKGGLECSLQKCSSCAPIWCLPFRLLHGNALTWPAIVVSLSTALWAIWHTLRQRGNDGWLPQRDTVMGFALGLGVFGLLGLITSLWWITYFVPPPDNYAGGTWAAVAWPFWHHLLPGAIFLVFWVSAMARILAPRQRTLLSTASP